MSNSGELAAAQAAKERPKVLVVHDDVMAGRALASVLGMASGIVSPAVLGACLPRVRAKKRHEPHQGAKERARRLKRMKAAEVVRP